MGIAQVQEYSVVFDGEGTLPTSAWFNSASPNQLVQSGGSLRVSSGAGNSTCMALSRNGASGTQAVYAETTSEIGYGNWGNSWGIFCGCRNIGLIGGSNTGYLVRYQFNNTAPALFRVNGAQSSEYTQISTGTTISLTRGDTLGIRATQLPNGNVLVEATQNGVVVNAFEDTSPLPIGPYSGLRMSRSSQSGSAMTGVTSFASGTLQQSVSTPRVLALAGTLVRGAGKLLARTVALSGEFSRLVGKKFAGTAELSGTTTVRALPRDTRKVRRVELMSSGWAGFLGANYWKARLETLSPWKLSLDGAPVIAGSVEEVRVSILYALDDEKPMPETAQIQIGAGEWATATVEPLTRTRGEIRFVTGPFVRGSYPVHVKFVSGDETPILYAGSIAVV